MERTFSEGQVLVGLIVVGVLAVVGGQARVLRVSRALGLEQLLASSFLFLPLGMLLSEAGLGVINRSVVHSFDALVTLGLGVLGLLLGLRLDERSLSSGGSALRRAAGVEMLFTLVLVGVPIFFLLDLFPDTTRLERASAAAMLGCAAAISSGQSLSTVSRQGTCNPTLVAQMADYGTMAGVFAAGVLLALLSPDSDMAPLQRLLALATIGTVGGVTTWLLASETRDEALRTALLMGVLLVTAGTAAHLSLPPVAATLITGLTIAHLPGGVARELRSSLAFLEAPLTVLLLVIAGAALSVPSWQAGVVLVLFLLLRTAGKLLGGRTAAKATGDVLPPLLGLGLLPSSAVALGLALDFDAFSRGPVAEVVVFTAVMGSMLSETAGVWTTRLLARALAVSDAVMTSPPPARAGAEPAALPPTPEVRS